MTNEELQRIGQYAAKIQGASGSLSVLAFDESQDLEMLIQKRLDESAAEGREARPPGINRAVMPIAKGDRERPMDARERPIDIKIRLKKVGV